MVEIVDESFTSRFIKIKEQREKNTKKYFIYQKIGKKGIFFDIKNDDMGNWGYGFMYIFLERILWFPRLLGSYLGMDKPRMTLIAKLSRLDCIRRDNNFTTRLSTVLNSIARALLHQSEYQIWCCGAMSGRCLNINIGTGRPNLNRAQFKFWSRQIRF